MKKMHIIMLSATLIFASLMLSACGGVALGSAVPETFVTVTDLRGDTIEDVPVNPTVVAIYCFGVLDTLYRAGWENTGIELLIVPSKDTLPDELGWFRDQPNESVVNGGTLHWVDWGVLDMAQPQLVITGQRSFAMDHNEQRLEGDEIAALRADTQERYDGTAFVHLGQDVDISQLENVERIASTLAQIFPDTANYLNTTFETFDGQIEATRASVEEIGATAMVVTLHSPFEFSVDVGTGMRTNVVFNTFGFTNPAVAEADTALFGTGDASTELVLRINPDVIFILPHSALADASAAINNFTSDSVIQSTNAYVDNNIFVLQQAPWHTLTTGFTGMEAMINDVQQFLGD
jgi:ABC-type enterochelin transport system substrate-binding protein